MNMFIKQAIKQFMPMIEEKAVPTVESLLDGIVEDAVLEPGEDSAAIVLQKYTTGDWWAYVVTLSPDNQIVRTVRQMKMQDIVQMALHSIKE